MFLKQISDRGKVLLIYVWLWCDLLLMGCLQMFKRFHDHNNRQGLVMSQECTCHLLDSTWPPRSWHHLSPSNSWHAASGKQQYYCQYVTIIVPTLGVYFQINPSSVLQTLLPLLHHHTVNFKNIRNELEINLHWFINCIFIYQKPRQRRWILIATPSTSPWLPRPGSGATLSALWKVSSQMQFKYQLLHE